MNPCKYYERDGITIWHADCRDVLPIIGPVVITDPPYSARTHEGQDTCGNDGAKRQELSYSHLTPDDCRRLAVSLHSVTNGWIVWFTDSELSWLIRGSMDALGRCTFAPLPFLHPGSTVRLAGDGPSSWAVWIMASRTKAQKKWGTLPGGYVAGPGWNDKQWIGGKPTALMTALVRDYSRPGDLICDPFMGAGTTLVAAQLLGRRAIGIDIDEEACEIAACRLSKAGPPLFEVQQPPNPNPEAQDLFSQ